MATTKGKNTTGTAVLYNQVAVTVARTSLVTYSKKMEGNIASINKEFNKFKDNWESSTATYYQTSVSKKITEIQKEQEILYNNLSKYLSSVVKEFEKAEKAIVKNADLFK